MSKDEALKLALEALENTSPLGFNMESDKRFYAAITAIREALAEQPAPMQGWKPSEADYKEWWGRHGLHGPTARAAFEDAASLYLTAAPQPAQQEPVAWLHKVTKLMVHADEIAKTSRNEDRINSGEFQALYTSPPAPHRKPLTDEEIESINVRLAGSRDLARLFARAIESAHGITKGNT